MAVHSTSQVIQHLWSVLVPDETEQTDGQLLSCFIESREEAAFAGLVKRHGRMVWNVCRRLLGPEDAEDAFQATFLVLCRKAASIRRRERVASYLYGVARQTALQARRAAARKRAREKQVVNMPEPAVVEQDQWNDLQPLLDQELSRLPENYQVVILLCDLEGRSRKEAAQQLALPEGTVASRLARARALLAKRLARHGLAITSAALAEMLSRQAMAACVPAAMAAATIRAAGLIAVGGAAAAGAVSVKVAALAEGVLKAMLLTKLKIALTVVAALALPVLAGVGAGLALAGNTDRVQTGDRIEALVKPHEQVRRPAPPLADQPRPPQKKDSEREHSEPVPARRSPSLEAVKRYLQQKYPREGDGSAGRLRWPPKTRITEVTSPILKKKLPRTCFFVTRLEASFLEYPEVALLISATDEKGNITFRHCFSPVFTDVPDDFLAQFHGLRAPTARDRQAVGEAIGTLLQRVTEKGELSNGDFRDLDSRLELWHNGHGWRDMQFQFDREGRLKSVRLSIHRDE